MNIQFKILFLLILSVTQLSCSTTRQIDLFTQRKPSSYLAPQLPEGLRFFLFAEQRLINRSVDESLIQAPTITKQSEIYRPENQQWFKLRSFWIPENELNVAELSNSSFHNERFIKFENNKRFFRFFIHPESEKFYQEIIHKYQEADKLLATSTSSSRTLLAVDKLNNFFFAKVSLDVDLGGVTRTIPKGEVARSVGFSKHLKNLEPPNSNFQMISEPLGIIPKGFKRGGQILRELPKKAFKNQNKLVPLFSLYSRAEGEETLLSKMLAQANDPAKFINDKILEPFAKAWLDWAINANLVMEAHAQNVLIQLNKNFIPTGRFFHRDLGGFNIEFSQRNLDQLPVFTTVENDYHFRFHKDAVKHSLKVYFEGGFIHNINKEFKRLGYGKYNFKTSFRHLLIKHLRLKLKSRLFFLDTGSLYYDLPGLVIDNRSIEVKKARCNTNFLDKMIKAMFFR